MSQESVGQWWADNPMTYGDVHGKTVHEGEASQLGDEAFFNKVDETFFEWNRPLHGEKPFDRLFPFHEVAPGAKVLEIGCGMGTMASLWARHGADVTAVDLNPTAIAQTRRRFELSGLTGTIQQADARQLPFDDGTFDYAWSWGVLHHSPDIEQSVAEMMRVLKPGGGFGLMLYHRQGLWQRYTVDYLEGFLHMESRFLGPLELSSRYGDGHVEEGNPYTWPMTRREVYDMLAHFSHDVRLRVLGTELDGVLRLMLPGLGRVLPRLVKKAWARRFGWSIWASGHKA